MFSKLFTSVPRRSAVAAIGRLVANRQAQTHPPSAWRADTGSTASASTERHYSDIRELAVTAVIGDDHNLPRIRDMRQGDKVSAVFTHGEFKSRLCKLREHMAEQRLSAVVLTSLHNVNYFSGFLYCYFGRNYALVVTPDDCVTVSAGIDAGQPWRRSHGEAVTYTDWRRDNFWHTIRTLLGNTRGDRLGIEFDHVTLENMKKFENVHPNFEFTDVGEATMYMRMHKSDEEIDLIRNGARIADIGGAAVVEALTEGVPEHEVALASTTAMIREIARTYPDVEVMDTWTWFQSGINTDGAHNPVTTRQVQKGDILSLNCFPMIAGYYTALERTMFLDHCSDAHLKLWEINCEVHRKGLELLKPGNKCCDIAHELNEIYRKYDLLKYRTFGYGHSFGSLCHYYGREKALELREDINTTLEPGMVVSMEPMITIPEGMAGAGGYREHDIVVIKENGAENITNFPFGPKHNIIKA